MTILLCISVFLAAYLVNGAMISLFYHRGLAHNALVLHPRVKRFVGRWGVWLTGIDPKAWVCMHRRHHLYSDQPRDPHSPVNFGLLGLLPGQLRSYERTLARLVRHHRGYTASVEDLNFPVSAVLQRGGWYLPYVLHLVIAVALSVVTGIWALGIAYFMGLMSHPLEGWVVNGLGHAVGGRNFDTDDNSRNNHFGAWLILGEGFQNNHHAYPESARFSYRRSEIDLGYALSLVLQRTGMLRVRRETLIPAPDHPQVS
ncbi:MAG: acyl-CoA desaturase [Deltaproteobacteria bacterium]